MQFKLSAVAALGLMTSLGHAQEPLYEWVCHAEGGPGKDGVLAAWDNFNQLFGTEALVIPGNSAFFAICDGLVFGLSNGRSIEITENLPLRSDAANSDPDIGSFCAWYYDSDMWEHYIFSKEGDITICEENCGIFINQVKRC